ncbi:hypothetical protein PCYB_003200 [Plasmodium cynomolgi strain B]|uniref:CYIR protein n=1 Tax=Plasmodium cynomolgi (strain B) TaxID=1120755 RepID=K6UF67_PLACD|nr:hypothetical protein PCYB_003200 [Plasmodium cynomolgi strain B]GAB69571.1 hypothetical protein PCYB_003200 [Plasmodium cynomolgi strain B]
MSNESNETYYNFEDYCRFRNIFEGLYEKSFDENIIQTFISNNKIEDELERQRFIYDCRKIQIYLKHVNTDDLCNNTKCCQYINYFLNDKISSILYKNKDNIFQLFMSYMQHDNKINTHMCVNKILKIDDDIQKKIKELYELYDLYEVIIGRVKFLNNNPSLCDTFNDFITTFNKVVEKNDPTKSSYLFNELKNLKCKIENDGWFSHSTCGSYLKTSWTNKNIEHYTKTCETEGKAMKLPETADGLREHQNTGHGGEIENGSAKANNLRPIMPISLVIIVGGTTLLFMYKVLEKYI